MDLGAYSQISDLCKIMEDNGIEVPRLRGLRLMKDETPLTKEVMNEIARKEGLDRCELLCRSRFNWNSCCHEFSSYTDAIAEYYMIFDKDKYGVNYCNPIDIRWDRLHGKKRKAFKYVIKRAKKNVFKQYEMFNKYCGREDVLYIHCRLGGGNRSYYKVNEIIEKQPWFLDDIDDSYDCTYMDIYAKIKEVRDESV